MSRILIQNGRIVTAADDYFADILVEDGKVALIGRDLDVDAEDRIDASNRLVLPGGVDPHTHMEMPFGGTVATDDFDTGTRAAAFGGTTTIVDFAIQQKGSSTLEALDRWQASAEKATIDYGFHMIITDMEEDRLPEMKQLAERGVTSYKMFMAYPGVMYVDDGTLFRTFRQAGENGTRACIHAENGIAIDELIKSAIKEGKTDPKWHAYTRPTRLEAEGVHRAISLAEVAGAPLYIVHMSCSDALEELKRARDRYVDVMGETCPQYLFLDESLYEKPGFEGAKWVMTPPLQEQWNQDELWKGLEFGHLSTIATDHCPFCYRDQKELGLGDFRKIPNGAPGVENRMSLIYTGGVVQGRFDLNRFVELTSTKAAKTFGMYPKKGTIAPGSDADLVVFDPERRETLGVKNARVHHMNTDYSAYEGIEVQGIPETVLSRGRVVVRNGEEETTGGGEFLKRAEVGSYMR